MTAATFESVTGLHLTGTPVVNPVIQALASSAADGSGPAYIVVGDARTRDERRIWTEGGGPLGDDIDAQAVAGDWNGFDFMALADRHCLKQVRGQLAIYVYPLRHVAADLHAGQRATPGEITGLLAWLGCSDAAHAVDGTPWLGFGPLLRNAHEATR